MLMADPAELRELIEQYDAAIRAHEAGGEQAWQRVGDVAYTLCVTTGTRHIDAALASARRRAAGRHHRGRLSHRIRLLLPARPPITGEQHHAHKEGQQR